jgi:hypothetical protein
MRAGVALAAVTICLAACNASPSSPTPSTQPDAAGFDSRKEAFCQRASVAIGIAQGVREVEGMPLPTEEVIPELGRDARAMKEAEMHEVAVIVDGLASELASVPEDLRVVHSYLDEHPSPLVVRAVRNILASEAKVDAISFLSSRDATRLLEKQWAGETWLSDSISLPASVVAETSEPVDQQLIRRLRAMEGVVDVQVLGGEVDPDRLAAFRLATLDLCPGIDLPPPDPQ